MGKREAIEIREQRVDEHFSLLARFIGNARLNDVSHVQAVIERIQVEMMIGRVSGRRKRFYRAAIEYLEDIVEERHEKEDVDDESIHKAVRKYVKQLFESLSD